MKTTRISVVYWEISYFNSVRQLIKITRAMITLLLVVTPVYPSNPVTTVTNPVTTTNKLVL